MEQQITPCLWYAINAQEASQFHCDIFNGEITHSNDLIVNYEINQRKFNAINEGPKFIINESVAFMVYSGSDQKIERIYRDLTKEGKVLMKPGEYPWTRKYAWVKDKFAFHGNGILTLLTMLKILFLLSCLAMNRD